MLVLTLKGSPTVSGLAKSRPARAPLLCLATLKIKGSVTCRNFIDAFRNLSLKFEM